MTTLRLALSELKRMTSGVLPWMAIIAMTLVPLLYGALYLYANWDPYSHLDNVKVALVNEDQGAQQDGKDLHVGDDVVDSLLKDATFGWNVVDSEAAAEEGVRTGEYAFAMTIPKDFSKNLASPEDFDAAQQAILQVTTNDANNYMVGTFADKLAGEVHNTVAKEVGTETADTLLTGYGRIHSQMAKAADGAGELNDGAEKLEDGIGTLGQGARKLDSGAGELDAGARKLHDGTSSLVAGEKKLVSGTASLASGAGELQDGADRLSGGLGTLESKTAKLPQKTRQLADGAASANAAGKKLASGADQVADGNEELSAKVGSAAETIKALQADADQRLEDSVQQLIDDKVITADEAEAARASVKKLAADSGVTARAEQAKKDLSTAQSRIDQLAAGSRQVATGASQLSGGLGTLATGADTLADSTPALVGGISDAANGADRLSSGAGQLASGANTLHAGQKDALSGAQQLNSGASSLADGTGSLKQGTSDLRDGISRLSSGAHQLVDGSGTLAAKLGDGTKQVPNPTDAQKTQVSNVIGDPVSVAQTDQASAGTYGEGLAPFFMTLAVWIGAFILVQIMRPVTHRALASNAASWKIAIGGWLPFLFLSMLQSTVLYGVVLFGLGLETAHPWLTWGLFLVASVAFTALVQGICALLGTPGKLVVLVLLVLQLVSAGGTFPWETTPDPLHVAHNLLPMGHVITGLRHLMYGATLEGLTPLVLSLLGYAAIGLAMSILAVHRGKTWTLKTLHPELAA
ncbi:YhgE/Pip family protein [Arthrobacter sp.]|uniref:YhgE/Pip family protein n=1 Tax=Arthrobacter sp. TaxID=1667 RepID=UPI003A9406FC